MIDAKPIYGNDAWLRTKVFREANKKLAEDQQHAKLAAQIVLEKDHGITTAY